MKTWKKQIFISKIKKILKIRAIISHAAFEIAFNKIREFSAVKIQTNYRGYLARRNNQEIVKKAKQAGFEIRVTKSAIKMQR